MNVNQIFSAFSQGINWNALYYVTYRILFTSLSFLLFYYLDTQDFSAWANINSIIFLILLWIDCGFRKSIPRYAPIFAQNKHTLNYFILALIVFQVSILITAVPVFFYVITTFLTITNSINYSAIIYLGCAIFVSEGLIALLRLLYHSYFWQKQFNTLVSGALIIEMSTNILCIMLSTTSMQLLQRIFITKLICGGAVIIIALVMLKKLYKSTYYQHQTEGQAINSITTTRSAFIKHSGMMWLNTNLKSLTERNVLIPFLTYMIGPAQANLFKVANDGALLFYRTIIKTIGTTDTSLFAYIEILPGQQKLIPIAFQKVTTKIISLCVPFLGIVGLLALKSTVLFSNPYVFQTFFILVAGYIAETILSPYERILEVKRRYTKLLIAYIPYIIMIMIVFLSNCISWIGLLGSILIIHSVRLVSSLIMAYYARKEYRLFFPIKFAGLMIGITVFLCVLFYLLLMLF